LNYSSKKAAPKVRWELSALPFFIAESLLLYGARRVYSLGGSAAASPELVLPEQRRLSKLRKLLNK
jgi:hypothetical protein